MRSTLVLAATLLAVSSAFASAGPASAAPLLAQAAHTDRNDNVLDIRWRGRGWHHGHRGWRHGYYNRGPGWGPALGGLAAGAIIGGAIANSNARAANDEAYCMNRYKSYDPGSGTYLGYDGNRHPCP
jgi:hypothetical protein